MDALRFFGLARTDDSDVWQLPVVPALCSGRGTLFGGCGLGAAIEALERTTGRPLVWATAQYLSYARPPSVVDIAITALIGDLRVNPPVIPIVASDGVDANDMAFNKVFPYESTPQNGRHHTHP